MDEKAVVTTPNATWMPEFPVAAPGRISTREDGRWGPQEYTLWPQLYHRKVLHHACIPVQGQEIDGFNLDIDDLWDSVPWNGWAASSECGVPDLGFLDKPYLYILKATAGRIDANYQMSARSQREDHNKFGAQLLSTVDQAIDQLTILPMSRARAIALAAHVQRLLLELCGLLVLYEIVQPRVLDPNNVAKNVLAVRGAFTTEAGTAQVLFRVGIPVWYIQPLTRLVRVVEVHTFPTAIASRLSEEVSRPQLLSDGGDLAGVVQHPGDWPFAMQQEVLKTLLGVKIPRLSSAVPVSSGPPPAKKAKSDVPGHPKPEHAGPAAPGGSSRRSTRRGKRAAPQQQPPLHPSQRYQSLEGCAVATVWADALAAVGTLATPPSPSTYYWPPPFLFEGGGEKCNRYYHNYARIRQFCRQRLLDPTLRAEPLRIAEWRDALWGDYRTQSVDVTSPDMDKRTKERRQLQQAIRRLFAGVAELPSYDAATSPSWGARAVSVDDAKEGSFHAQVLWEVHEVNWRCEMRELDAELTQSREWDTLARWEREARVSRIWSSIGSGLRLWPCWENDETTRAQWTYSDDEADQSHARSTLCELLAVIARWPGLPEELKVFPDAAMDWPSDKFTTVQRIAVEFYVHTFVRVFKRLPIPPAVVPVNWP
ncbi:uncharacterized protein C8Q71DRAFT_717264 [Rhodofomes roseus]|uniref:Uncharacterized protein n=1 Tax=Rhodofomes roseus TaxID=34475 RepID=A0ABQ8K0L1_9APHY|nr:uncharacterized protein C8Q71DRAFT_717264 [Rhodofomes roseus]KAH9830169.1 hypothetical protein C8Q71DRAFT_717264 [Rhodofomes roseus]